MAYCWDLETNYRETKVFTVQHIRETKKGAHPLTDSRDIYEMVANQAARRERACILSVIPGDVVDAAVGQCNVTLSGNAKMPLVDMVRHLVKNFQEQYGVTAEMLEAYIGCKKEAFSSKALFASKTSTTPSGTALPAWSSISICPWPHQKSMRSKSRRPRPRKSRPLPSREKRSR